MSDKENKLQVLDREGLIKYDALLKTEIAEHTENNDIHVTSDDKTKISLAYEHAGNAHAPTSAEPNEIVSIKKNGTTLPIDASRAVDIVVPTKLSEFENDANFLSNASMENLITEHNVNAEAHADIRALIDDVNEWLKVVLDSDDETLNQMSEIVAYIKLNKSLIESVTTSKVNVSDIIDNLTTNSKDKVLAASQGVAIKALIDALDAELDALTTTVGNKADKTHTHNYAGSATVGGDAYNALKLQNMGTYNGNNDSFLGIPYINADGVMEIGKHLDFHVAAPSDVDHDARITARTDGLTLAGLTLGTFQGNLTGTASKATLADTASKVAHAISINGKSYDGSAAVDVGTLGLAYGGTGATTAPEVLTNLGLTATAAELNYMDGVTRNVQTQLNEKFNKTGGNISGSVNIENGANYVHLSISRVKNNKTHSAAILPSSDDGSTIVIHQTDGVIDNQLTLAPTATYLDKPLAVNSGGTGFTTAKEAINMFINALDTGSATPQDADYYISQFAGGGTTTTTYHRRPMSALWSYINGKITANSISTPTLTLTSTNAAKHLEFSRGGYNYITTPSSGSLAFVMNGKEINQPNSTMIISTDSVFPGTTNIISLGSSTYKWSNVYATTFYGELSGNATTASQIYVTTTNPSSGTKYFPTFVSNTGGTTYALRANNGICYWTSEGTTSVVGVAQIGLGNTTPSGTAGNKTGAIYMYGNSSGYTQINPSNHTTSNVNLYLPSGNGTLARTVDTVAKSNTLALANGTADNARPVIFQDSGLSTSVLTACYDSDFTYNPSKNILYAGHMNPYNSVGKESYILYPSGGTYVTSTNTHTGYLKITLPVSWTSTMLRFRVSIYNYVAGTMCDYYIGGYNYNDTNSGWHQCTAYSTGKYGSALANLPVTFGHDGSKCAVTIGNADTSWSYVQVQVSEVQCGYGNYTYSSWYSGWSISFTTTALSNQTSISNPHVSASVGNADTLDGYHGSTSATKNTYVLRSSDNYIYTNYINSNTGNNENPSISQIIVTNGSDNYYRKASLSHLKSSLGVSLLSGSTFSGTLLLGAYTNDSTLVSGGIKVHDLRSVTPTPDMFGNQVVNFYFDQSGTDGDWKSILHVKGWNGAYAAHELAFNATSSNKHNLAHRTGIGTSWESWRTILDSGNYSNYALPLSGGTMSGNIVLPNNKAIVQHQSSTSNSTTVIKWYKGGTSQATYDPGISQHNTGGDGTGSITILPYPTESNPWEGAVGLFIQKGAMKVDGNAVLTAGNYTSYWPVAFRRTYLSNTGVNFNTSTYLTGRVTVNSGSATNTNAPSGLSSALTVWNIPILHNPYDVINHSAAWQYVVQVACDVSGNLAIRSVSSASTAGSYTYGSWRRIIDSGNYMSYALPLTAGSNYPLTGALYFKTNSWTGDIIARNTSNQPRYEMFSASNSGAVAPFYIRVYNNDAGSTYVNYAFGTNGVLSLAGLSTTGSITSGGKITGSTTQGSWISCTRNGAFRLETAATGGAASSVVSMKTATGAWSITNLSGSDTLYFCYGTDTNYNANTNTTTQITFNSNGTIGASITGAASKVYVGANNPSSETRFYPTMMTGSANANCSLYENSSISCAIKYGTADAVGYNYLILGNGAASGTAGNYYGVVRYYSTSTGYCDLRYTAATGSVTNYLPASSGTLLNTANYSSYALPLSGGSLTGDLTTTGTIHINNTSAASDMENDTVGLCIGAKGGNHLEIDSNTIQCKSSATAGRALHINPDSNYTVSLHYNQTGSLRFQNPDSTSRILCNSNVTIQSTKASTSLLGSITLRSAGYWTSSSDYNNGSIQLQDKNSTTWIHLAYDATSPYFGSKAIYNRTTSSGSAVYVSSAGVLMRYSSASKYKADIQPITDKSYAYNVLKLTPKSWYDKSEMESYTRALEKELEGENPNDVYANYKHTSIERIHGLVAEDVEAAGLEKYCVYEVDAENNTKEIEGINYEKVTTLLIPVVRDLVLYTQKTAKYIHVDEMADNDRDEIAELLTRINSFKQSEVIS